MRPKASSSRFKLLFFSTCHWGSVSLPIVILYMPSLRKDINISSLQSDQLKGVRIRGTRAKESIFLYVEQSIPQEDTQIPANNTSKTNSIHNYVSFKPFHLDMYTFLESVTPVWTSLDRIQRDQCYYSRIYVETQLLLVYNGDWIRLVAILNKAMIACQIYEPLIYRRI